MNKPYFQSDDFARDPDWPLRAVPQRWIESLFAVMSAHFGARFSDLWRGVDLVATKRHWGVEMSKLSSEQLKVGVERLAELARAPDCSEFVAHCRRARLAQQAFATTQLTDGRRSDAETATRNLAPMREIAGHAQACILPNPSWAFGMLLRDRGKNGPAITAEVQKHCRDAVLSGAGHRYALQQAGTYGQQCRELLDRLQSGTAPPAGEEQNDEYGRDAA